MATLNAKEVKSVLAISLIASLRLLGVFLVLPIFSVYAMKYEGATMPLSGLAFGIYPLFQGFVQFPFGWASDRFGRRVVFIAGLAIFTLGSLYAALASDIYHLIAARALQGCGAVGAVAMAAVGDLTRESVRTQAFTLLGVGIGFAFVIGLIGGPILAARFGFSSLFYVLAALGAIAILITLFYFPATETNSSRETRTSFYKFMLQLDLRTLFTAALVSSLVLNLFFFLYPISWTHLGVERASLWKIYLVALLPSALFVFPYIRRSERKGNLGSVPLFGYLSMLLGFVIYLFGSQWEWSLYATAALFFLGYTVYQSFVPAFITQRTPKENRGAAMGFYNLSAFFGSSIGGIVAGSLYNFGSRLPVIAGLVVLVFWLFTGLPRHVPSELTGE